MIPVLPDDLHDAIRAQARNLGGSSKLVTASGCAHLNVNSKLTVWKVRIFNDVIISIIVSSLRMYCA